MLFLGHETDQDSASSIEAQAIVCQSYSRALLETRLSSRLKKTVRVDSGGLEIGTFTQFEDRVDSPSSLCSFLVGDRHRAVVEINQSLAFSSVDILMGGKGFPPVETRPLSPLERNLMSGIFESMASDFGRAWHQLLPHPWKVAQEAQFTYSLEGFHPQEKMLIALFEIGIEELAQGMIQLAIPLSALSPGRVRATAVPEELIDPLESPLTQILPLTLNVILPPTQLTVGRLLELEVGDVLEFTEWELAPSEDQSIEVVVCVEDQPRFSGKLGVMNNKKAVEINSKLDPDEYSQFDEMM